MVGIHLCGGEDTKFVQLVGKDIMAQAILETLSDVEVIYTCNGSRFDLPFIYCRLGINLAQLFKHRDLMYDCWNRNLYGGFKVVERPSGIEESKADVNEGIGEERGPR